MLARRTIGDIWPDPKPFLIETERMRMMPLRLSELIAYVASGSLPDGADREYAMEKFVPDLIRSGSRNYVFHTFWTAVSKEKGEFWGDFMFHGEPWGGKVEIGYKTRFMMQDKGVATEMLGGMIKWARDQRDIKVFVAVAENAASERVLEKNGFVRSIKNEFFELKIR